MKILCQVTWTKLGIGNGRPSIRVKYGHGLTSDWIEVDKAPALMSHIQLEEEQLRERATNGETKYINLQTG